MGNERKKPTRASRWIQTSSCPAVIGEIRQHAKPAPGPGFSSFCSCFLALMQTCKAESRIPPFTLRPVLSPNMSSAPCCFELFVFCKPN